MLTVTYCKRSQKNWNSVWLRSQWSSSLESKRKRNRGGWVGLPSCSQSGKRSRSQEHLCCLLHSQFCKALGWIIGSVITTNMLRRTRSEWRTIWRPDDNAGFFVVAVKCNITDWLEHWETWLRLTWSAIVRPSLSILDPASAIFFAALITSEVFFRGPLPLQKEK